MHELAQPWWSTYYAELAAVLPEPVDQSAVAEVDLVESLGEFQPGDRILDVGCGLGRHCILLQERSYAATGVDISRPMLEGAAGAWARRHAHTPGPDWVEADMRSLPDVGTFDHAVLLGSSLGMFDDEADHLRALMAVFAVVREGGSLILSLPNPFYWAQEARTRHIPPAGLVADADVVRTRRFDVIRGRLDEELLIFHGGIRRSFPIASVRAWTPPEIVALVKSAGFRQVRIHGAGGDEFLPVASPLDVRRNPVMWLSTRT